MESEKYNSLFSLQNYFGVIRGHNGYNEHPSAAAFRGTVRLTAACQMVRAVRHGNCASVDDTNLMSMMDALRELLHRFHLVHVQ